LNFTTEHNNSEVSLMENNKKLNVAELAIVEELDEQLLSINVNIKDALDKVNSLYLAKDYIYKIKQRIENGIVKIPVV